MAIAKEVIHLPAFSFPKTPATSTVTQKETPTTQNAKPYPMWVHHHGNLQIVGKFSRDNSFHLRNQNWLCPLTCMIPDLIKLENMNFLWKILGHVLRKLKSLRFLRLFIFFHVLGWCLLFIFNGVVYRCLTWLNVDHITGGSNILQSECQPNCGMFEMLRKSLEFCSQKSFKNRYLKVCQTSFCILFKIWFILNQANLRNIKGFDILDKIWPFLPFYHSNYRIRRTRPRGWSFALLPACSTMPCAGQRGPCLAIRCAMTPVSPSAASTLLHT